MRASSSFPRACSGDMYATVPTAEPGLVRSFSTPVCVASADDTAALPRHLGQSEVENLGVAPLGHEDVCRLDVTMDDTFRWAASSASAISIASDNRVSNSSGRSPIKCFRVWPSRNSMAMNAWPSSSPMSWIVQIFG